MSLLLIILVIFLLLGGFGSYSTFSDARFGPVWGGGIGLGTILVVLLILYLFRR